MASTKIATLRGHSLALLSIVIIILAARERLVDAAKELSGAEEFSEERNEILDATPATQALPTADPASLSTNQGVYVVPAETLITPEGEVPLDLDGKQELPKQLNDGELEGGDRHTLWSYLDQLSWQQVYPECKGENRRQSPIDIITDSVTFNPRMMLELVDYDQEIEFELKNTHHSVTMTPIASLTPPSLKLNWNGGKDATDGNIYDLQEIHFHWGDGRNKGSEHEINDKKAAAEMHMVHYRRGLRKDQIGSVDNSVAVIGVFIESDDIEHNKLESLIKKSEKVNGTDLEYKDNNPENLINLLPENHHSFYTYNGSLTTPPCYETVTWIIMSEPVFMSQASLVELSNLEMAKPGVGRKRISSNCRDIQPLLGRPVYASFNATDETTYELSSDFKQKRIGEHNPLFRKALDQYWAQVNRLRVSVRTASQALAKARDLFLSYVAQRKIPWPTAKSDQESRTPN